MPRAIRRLDILKKVAEALVAFCGEDDSEITRQANPIAEVFKIIARFQTEVVEPLDAAMNRQDETQAEQLVKSLKGTLGNLAREAEDAFERTVKQLEEAVVNSVIYRCALQSHFVSVVSLDLAQYGAHSKVVHDYAQADGIFALNRRVRSEVKEALQLSNVPADNAITIDTGDGAIIIFTRDPSNPESIVSERAFVCAQAFLTAIARLNENVEVDNRLHFRVGICSGIVAMEQARVRGTDMVECHAGGLSIGTAVRLQSAARTGEIIACSATWGNLNAATQGKFDAQEDIFGKIHEKVPIKAHRFQCVGRSPEERAS